MDGQWLLGLIVSVIALWDFGRRRLSAEVVQHSKILAQTNSLASCLETYTKQLMQLETQLKTKIDAGDRRLTESLETSTEYMRAVLAGFISSATAIVKLSEDEKRQLQNKLSASRLNTR